MESEATKSLVTFNFSRIRLAGIPAFTLVALLFTDPSAHADVIGAFWNVSQNNQAATTASEDWNTVPTVSFGAGVAFTYRTVGQSGAASDIPDFTAYDGTTYTSAMLSAQDAPGWQQASDFTLQLDMTGLQDIEFSFAYLGLQNGGGWSMVNDAVEYSTDGGSNWTAFDTGGTLVPITSGGPAPWGRATVNLSTVSAIDNQPDVQIRYTFTPSAGFGGGDNLRVEAFQVVVVPEPATFALVGMAGMTALMMARRRRRRG